MTQAFRLPRGGIVDRSRPMRFTFDDAAYEGFAGDTLASALLASGVHLVARSFKYHRPRGIFTAGSEEPSALVQLGAGADTEPNVRATTVELFEGLTATSQNRWPSLRHDVGALNDVLSPLLPAGFYYKTFMWPSSPRAWLRYEHAIRRMAGMGRAATEPDPDVYEHRNAHCDVLVIGGSDAGLSAARAAATSGDRVILCDEHALDVAIAGVTVLARTTAFGIYDGLLVGAIEQCAKGIGPRQRLWKVRAGRVVLATGALERGIVYANNDLPGTMLAGAARRYVEHHAVRPGSRAVVFTNNDAAYATADVLREAGVDVAQIVDAREGRAVRAAHGRLRVRAVDIGAADGRGATTRVECDLVCVSGGFNPLLHLYAQARGTLRYDDALCTFVPHGCPLPVSVVGAAAGEGLPKVSALWAVPGRGKRFVDLQNDVTASDVELAVREGYTSVEHLKRYTTLGMGTDQGKTSNVVGIALLAESTGAAIPAVGTTTFRPPFVPVTLGAVPGVEQRAHVAPVRRSAVHDWHAERGARFVNAGLWLRPHSYPRQGESEDDAANREARNVRTNVGVVDVSTLGKIELMGRDVATLLGRLYVNNWDNLPVGRCRYGVMLRDDGIVLDDGTTSRLAESHYLMTTTTVNAVRVMQQIEFLLQTTWRDLHVHATSVTEQWCAAAISGPRSRDVVAALVDIDVSNAAFPFLAVAQCNVRVAGESIAARLFRMSYSGELAYELHCGADRGRELWEAIVAAGEPFGLMPYGTEAMSTLRIEKGHIVVGAEADGRTTADDLGLGGFVSAKKWCVGKPMLSRPGLVGPDRWQLVGLTALDGAAMPRAAKLVVDADRALPNPMEGHVTSWCYSPNLERWIALALLANGRARHGETIWALSPLAGARVRVQVGPPCFIDAEGTRLRA